jgi:xanthine dehydrogenase large subunit
LSRLPLDTAHTHVAGQSEYIDDRPRLRGEIDIDVLPSPHAHARIKAIRTEKALRIPGVLAIYSAKDFHSNIWGSIFKDQPLLAEHEVQYAGEIVAIIAAESRAAAREARGLIEVDYELLPAILSIRDAIRAKSFIASKRQIARGDVERALHAAPHRLEGEIVIRGQDHFYLESQASIVYPKEDGQLEVHTSAQHPTEVQHVVAHAVGLPQNDVVCIVKRMGGGFGGKESQAAPFAAYAALAASRLKRPARIVLSKDDDMIMTGKRNPFENRYRVGFDSEGHILALDVELFSDAGAYADLSTSIMERAMLHTDNAYFFPHFRVTGQVCKTNYHSHTAFRGFGGPKGVATIEKIIECVAHRLKKDPLEIRMLNVYSERESPEGGTSDVTPYGQKVANNCLPRLLHELAKKSDYSGARARITKENRETLDRGAGGKLKGLSLTPVKFGISFTTRFLNQANALVVIHRDGTLQVSTGATEMGQGVNARIAEVVATELGIPRGQVRVMTTSTEKNANTSPTAASSGTDLNAAAALLAARKIKARLSQLAERLFEIPESRWAKHTAGLGTEDEIVVPGLPHTVNDPNEGADWPTGVAEYCGIVFDGEHVYRRSKPDAKIAFSALVHEAYHQRISLSDYSHYRIPGLSFNKLTGKGDAFMYFTQGAAVSEVSLDRDTGEVKVDRVEILMDLGRSINAALDEGQVSGGFIQGMGWVTTEKLFYTPKGAILSHSPSTYKIPSVQDTPRTFRIELLSNNENYANVRGTKAVGEPPLLLGISVWTAISDALSALPVYGATYPEIELPATGEVVLAAMEPARFARWREARMNETRKAGK